MIMNLLSNALKFTPAGGEVSVYLQQVENLISIRVTDTGIGIVMTCPTWLNASIA
jgi:signal transduction histidine kinase